MSAQKYFFDDHKDKLIREAYQSPDRRRHGGTVSVLATRLGIPRCIILRRARMLGLNPPITRYEPWTKAEDDLLLEHAWKCPEVISRHMKKAGFSRSANAIEQRLQRTHGMGRRDAILDAGLYTLRDSATLLGCEQSLLSRLIAEKKLNAIREGNRSDGRAVQWLIHEKDLRKFVINYTAHLNFARIDKFWLVDLLTGSSKPKQLGD